MRFQVMDRLGRSRRLRAAFGLWLVAALTLGAPWLDAATYYVDDGTGIDARSPAQAQSPSTPWKTITHALSQATNGDTVNVADGVYNSANGESFPLALGNGVALVGAGAGSVTSVAVTNGGSGYSDEFTVTFTGGGGTGAEGFALASGGVITDIVVTGGGGGYTSAPTVDLTAGGGSGGAATASIGPGASTITAPEGTSVFFNNNSLNANTRLSGFLIKHDTVAANDNIVEFAVGNGVTQSPRIDHNALFDNGAGDTAILFYDDSTGAGTFTPTIDHNTMSDLNEGIWGDLSDGAADGGADHYGGTFSNNTFSNVTYPLNWSFSFDNGGTIDPVVDSNETWKASDDIYLYGDMGPELTQFSPTFSNNTLREATDEGVYTSITLDNGAHTYEPTFTNNTIASPSSEGMSFNLSVSVASATGAMTMRPTITGNTITNTGYGIDMTLGQVHVPDGTNVEFSPTITNNTIDGTSVYGVFLTISSVTDGNYLSNVTITGNDLSNDKAPIYAEISELYSAGLDNYQASWNISNNTITDGRGSGIYLSLSSLTGADPGSVQNTTVTGNTVSGMTDTGIYIFLSPGTGAVIDQHLTVAGNTVTNSDNDGILVYSEEAGKGTNSILIQGNTITGSGGDGLFVELSSQTDLASATYKATENYIDGGAGNGIEIAEMSGLTQQMIFSCNTVTNNAGGGVYINSSPNSTAGGTNLAVNFGDSTAASPGHNSIFNNAGGTYDFDNSNAKVAKAENNWWGTATQATIASHINGNVDFQPFLAAAVTPTATTAVVATLQNDADASGTPTVGDTIRFCTTVTAGANCGPAAITLSVPLPGNVTLVDGSVTTGGNGAYDPNQPAVTVTGITLDAGQSADICFDVVVNSGSAVSVTATATAVNMAPASDSATVTLGAVVPIPTLGEWARIFIPLLLLAVGVIAARRRKQMIAMMIAAAFLTVAPARLNAAPAPHASKGAVVPAAVDHESVAIVSVTLKDHNVTLTLADGRSFTVGENQLHVKDRSVTGAEKRAARKEERDAARAAGTFPEKQHATKITPAVLASMVQPRVTTEGSGRESKGQPAVIKVQYDGEKVRAIDVKLYASDADAHAAADSYETAKIFSQTLPVETAKTH